MNKRIIGIYLAFSLAMFGTVLQLFSIVNEYSQTASESYSTKTLSIASTRATIYDRNLLPLVNTQTQIIAAVTDGQGSDTIDSIDMTSEQISDKLASGYPFVTQLNESVELESVICFDVPIRYSEDSLASHLIGYLDYEGNLGLMGIEKAYNEFLNENGGAISVSYQVDANGSVIAGIDAQINDDNYYSSAGVVLTIDSEIQQVVETALQNSTIESGAVIVMHVDTGEILALASYPDFDPNDVSSALTADNSPLINKALQSYSVGSVFKPIVAAVALENGVSEDLTYECTGSIELGDTIYSCNNTTAHGIINMTEALEVSCNCYFISLIQQLDTDYLLKFCEDIGFSQSDMIAENISTASGILPTSDSLDLIGNLANFAFGQGDFSATPIQLAKAYNVLATGYVVEPTVIRGFTNYDGLLTLSETADKQKLLSDATVSKLKTMLESVVINGNANSAYSELVSVSGKTGTAQSGIFDLGEEICRTWFTGFFPSENPHYIVIVLNENGVGGGVDCAPVFLEICEGIVMAQ